MGEVNRNTLKTYFNTGDKPTEAQFVDFIDSAVNKVNDSSILLPSLSASDKYKALYANGDADGYELIDRNLVNARSFGVVGDDSTDDTAALNAFSSYLVANEVDGYIPSDMVCLTSDTFTVPGNANFYGHGQIKYTGSGNQVGVEITDNDFRKPREYFINVERATISDWTDEASIGIQTKVALCNINVIWCKGFTVGVQTFNNASNAYNHFNIQRIQDCRIGFDLNADTGGFANQNTVFIHEIAVASGTLSGRPDPIGIRLTDIPGATPNNNVFINPSCEIGTPGSSIGLYIEGGADNQFYGLRAESNDIAARIDSNIVSNVEQNRNNFIVLGNTGETATFEDNTGGFNNILRNWQDTDKVNWWNSPKFVDNYYQVASGNAFCLGLERNDDVDQYDKRFLDSQFYGLHSNKPDYVNFNNASGGFTLDLKGEKQFYYVADVDSGDPPNLEFRFFDSDGNKLDEATDGVRVFKGFNKMTYNGSLLGGVFQNPSSMDDSLVTITIQETGSGVVDYVDFCFRSGWLGEISIGLNKNNPEIYTRSWPSQFPKGSELLLPDGDSIVRGFFNSGAVGYYPSHSAGGSIGEVATGGNFAVQGSWTNSTSYFRGNWVEDGGDIYEAQTKGTSSGTGVADDVGVTWGLVAETWTDATSYNKGVYVLDGGQLYQALNSGTSSGTGVADDSGVNWLEVNRVTAINTITWKTWGSISA